MALNAQDKPKYANVLNSGVGVLGTGASTVGATVLGTDGIAADAKACYAAGSYGGMCESLYFNTNDTAAVNAFVYILDGSTVIPIGIVNIPASSGNSATVPNVDGIAALLGCPVNAQGKKYIPLKAGQIVKVSVLAAMTANKQLWASTSGIDYVA